jgi:hypothetical protein
VTSRAAGTAAAAFVGPCSSADAASVGKGPSCFGNDFLLCEMIKK